MNCQWEEFNGKYKCKNCGFIVPRNSIKKQCGKVLPSLIRRGKNLGKAIVNHIKTGLKHCSENDRQARLEICKKNTCGLFVDKGDGGICSHKSCGCYLRNHGKFMDKLSWAESKCPVGLWGQAQPKEENI